MNGVSKTREETEREGWKLASVTGGEHLARILDIYREMEFEVYLEEVTPEQCGGCTECYRAAGEKIFRIYTKTTANGWGNPSALP